jgi:anti-anti-sigma factor
MVIPGEGSPLELRESMPPRHPGGDVSYPRTCGYKSLHDAEPNAERCTNRPRRQEEFGDRPPNTHMTYSLTITTTPRSATFRIAGDLDYETTDELVEAASRVLARRNDLSDLHLDFSETTFLDSAALSGLLLIHRRTAQAGVALHLDHRPTFLDRVLQVTGLFSHFDLTRTEAETGDPTLLGQSGSSESSAR